MALRRYAGPDALYRYSEEGPTATPERGPIFPRDRLPALSGRPQVRFEDLLEIPPTIYLAIEDAIWRKRPWSPCPGRETRLSPLGGVRGPHAEESEAETTPTRQRNTALPWIHKERDAHYAEMDREHRQERGGRHRGAALQKLGMDRDEVSVEILEQAKSGF